jgi:hypothetical protein
MRITITIDDDGETDVKATKAVSANQEEEAQPNLTPDVAARAAASGAASGGPAPVGQLEATGDLGAPPAFIPEAPGSVSTEPLNPAQVHDEAHATSAGAAPFGPEPEPPVEVSS